MGNRGLRLPLPGAGDPLDQVAVRRQRQLPVTRGILPQQLGILGGRSKGHEFITQGRGPGETALLEISVGFPAFGVEVGDHVGAQVGRPLRRGEIGKSRGRVVAAQVAAQIQQWIQVAGEQLPGRATSFGQHALPETRHPGAGGHQNHAGQQRQHRSHLQLPGARQWGEAPTRPGIGQEREVADQRDQQYHQIPGTGPAELEQGGQHRGEGQRQDHQPGQPAEAGQGLHEQRQHQRQKQEREIHCPGESHLRDLGSELQRCILEHLSETLKPSGAQGGILHGGMKPQDGQGHQGAGNRCQPGRQPAAANQRGRGVDQQQWKPH